jgi:hypothetical protein
MTCPYLKQGRTGKCCEAYLGSFTAPSYYEAEYLCLTCSHTDCVWYMSKLNAALSDGTRVDAVPVGCGNQVGLTAGLEALLN